VSGFVPTEPGTLEARAIYGCTCPPQSPVPIAGGGVAYARSEDCPLHSIEQTPRHFARGQGQAKRWDDEKAGMS
jgi:hypothetical protein